MKAIINKFEKDLNDEIVKRDKYFNSKSENWQESEKGEEYQNSTEVLMELYDEVLETLTNI